MADTPRTVSCPTCSKPVVWSTESRYRPFCSARCRQIDLGAWASEAYRVPSSPPDAGEAEDFLPPGQARD
ncbi:DNA gyrase inhibitor YacG [Thauera sp.]|uniref:DNA gyrase inhibitor YacG n=1 Tax=Thauera sp. TaxID=1905334 RepID=UPI0039E319E7